MTPVSQKLYDVGEVYAGALLEYPEKSPIWRYSYALASFLRHAEPAPYDGGRLYPCGYVQYRGPANDDVALLPDYSYTYRFKRDKMKEKCPEGYAALMEEFGKVPGFHTPHLIGGDGYTHSFINFRRILGAGLIGYRRRVEALPDGEFRDAMLLLLDAIEDYRARCVRVLRDSDAPADLIAALERVPTKPVRNIYEALVSWNFMYYMDGCDNIGGLDRGLAIYWRGEDIVDLLRELYQHMDLNCGWSEPLGPYYSGLAVQCIKAVKGIRRPSIQLLISDEMTDELWDAACETIESSCGQPAFYNWESYKREFRKRLPQVTEKDLEYLAFGGCTETMIEGLSNVGSDDGGLNSALIFDRFMRDHLADCADFDSFMDGYIRQCKVEIEDLIDQLEAYRKARAIYRPQPLRTLFVDDCLDKMLDFNAGGARYNWSVINVAGLINVIDSMAVIKSLVYDNKTYTADEFLKKLDGQDPVFLGQCREIPKHGNDDPGVNAIAEKLSAAIYGDFERYACTPGGRYFAVSNQFVTYVYAGSMVRSTPDGRVDWEPLCDSCSAVHGRDHEGPTAMLNSVTSLRLDLVLGTPVTNIRLSKDHVRPLLRSLVEGYFKNGGVQLQVTCASRKELEDAVAHPEQYGNLIVRIGGYSEYFTRLSPEYQQTVIDRTEY